MLEQVSKHLPKCNGKFLTYFTESNFESSSLLKFMHLNRYFDLGIHEGSDQKVKDKILESYKQSLVNASEIFSDNIIMFEKLNHQDINPRSFMKFILNKLKQDT